MEGFVTVLNRGSGRVALIGIVQNWGQIRLM